MRDRLTTGRAFGNDAGVATRGHGNQNRRWGLTLQLKSQTVDPERR
jgi:hypothetical protein